MKHVFAVAAFSASLAWAAPACNNANLKDLLAKGFPQVAIMNAISARSDCTFAVSKEALDELRALGASEKLIELVTTKAASQALGGESNASPEQPPVRQLRPRASRTTLS